MADDADDQTIFRTCPLCEATCGLEITVRDGAVHRIRGDRQDVFSNGFICPKGSTLKQLHEDPDRIRTPLIRDGENPDGSPRFREAEWDEAFAAIETGMAPFLANDRNAIGAYLGNPNVHNLAASIFNRPLVKALGSRNVFTASTVDQMPKHVSSGWLFGSPGSIPVPDIDRTDFLLMLGADPWESNGSLCTAPGMPDRLTALQERGGRFVVVDPRHSRSAAAADEHVPIRPGTDALLLAAIVTELDATGQINPGRLGPHTSGLDDVVAALAEFTPESVAAATGVDAETTRRLAAELAGAERAVTYGRIGTTTTTFGTLASWLIDVINLATGNLDEPGGAMFPTAATGPATKATPGGRGFATGRWESRVNSRSEVLGEYPVADLPEEILTEGDGQIRALVTVAGNPARSCPDSDRIEEALASLEFMVSVDIYLNETTRFANVILPARSALEKSHYDIAFYGLAVRNVANWSPPVFESDGPTDDEIHARLGLILAGLPADSDPALAYDAVIDTVLDRAIRRSGSPVEGTDADELKAQLTGETASDRALDAMLRVGAYGDGFGADPDGLTLAKLKANPHGIDLGPLESRLPNHLSTASGTIELNAPGFMSDLPRLAASMSVEPAAMTLVGRRHVRSNNSWMHNVNVLVKGRERCTLWINPSDANARGIEAGGLATVASAAGMVEATVEITDDIMAGVVSLPHGWGHSAPGARMQVAAERPGVNSNVLTDDAVDPLSGTSRLNGIPVTVTAV